MKMKYYKNGNSVIATVGTLDLPEITAEEYAVEMEKARQQMEEQAKNFHPIPTAEERLEAVEAAFLELAEVLFNG